MNATKKKLWNELVAAAERSAGSWKQELVAKHLGPSGKFLTAPTLKSLVTIAKKMKWVPSSKEPSSAKADVLMQIQDDLRIGCIAYTDGTRLFKDRYAVVGCEYLGKKSTIARLYVVDTGSRILPFMVERKPLSSAAKKKIAAISEAIHAMDRAAAKKHNARKRKSPARKPRSRR